MADTLSHLIAIHCNNCPPVSFQEMAEEQHHDSELVKLQQTSTSMTLQAIPLPTSKGTIICDVSTGVSRPLVPRKFRRTVFNSLHSLPTQASAAHNSLLPTATSGPILILMCASGHEPVWYANKPKFKDTLKPHQQPLQPQMPDSIKFILTLWDHSHHLMVSATY